MQDDVVGAAAYALQGDCLVNLDRLDEAAGKFEKAIKTSDANPAYTPTSCSSSPAFTRLRKNMPTSSRPSRKSRPNTLILRTAPRGIDAMIDLAPALNAK